MAHPRVIGASIRCVPAFLTKIRLGRKGLPGMHSSLLQTFVNYGREEFYYIWPGKMVKKKKNTVFLCHILKFVNFVTKFKKEKKKTKISNGGIHLGMNCSVLNEIKQNE
jgi:hypothetical protein